MNECSNVCKIPAHTGSAITLDVITVNCILFSQIHTRSSPDLVNFLSSNYKKKKLSKDLLSCVWNVVYT